MSALRLLFDKLPPAALRETGEAASLFQAAATPKLLRGHDIKGPAMVYVTYGGCDWRSQPHNFTHIEAVARRANVPIYVISVNPDLDSLVGKIDYLSPNPRGGMPLVQRAPGNAVFPFSNEDARTVATRFGLSVNPANLSGHSNRLVFINADEKPVASIPSTQPVDRIISAAPWAFKPARTADRGASIG